MVIFHHRILCYKLNNMKTINENNTWGTRSVSWWLTMLIALAIIFVGARFILDPLAGAAGFGVAFTSKSDFPFGWIKGIRDISSGVVLLPLLILRMRKAVAYVFTATVIVPATDFLIVLIHNGSADIEHLLVHGLTALYMIVTSFLLFGQRVKSA